MEWFIQAVYWIPLFLTVVILLILFRIELLKGGIAFPFLRKMILLVIGIAILGVFGKITFFYVELKKSPIGLYLLPGEGTTYFIEKVWQMALPVIIGALIGIILLLVVVLVRKYSQRPLFTEIDQWILFLGGFTVGYPSILVLVLGSMLIMIIFLIIASLFNKVPIKDQRIMITPYVIFTTIAILILRNFSFYINFIS